ncbi:MAG: AAA family ATPase [Thermodesulfobacteriota bacterium]|nr:AAA family ATPase [Thermodesulfobacteriota bacterium]
MEFESWFQKTQSLLNRLPATRRYLYDKIDWEQRCIGILGSRGTGKTTLILQYLKKNHGGSEKALYVPLDHPGFQAVDLYAFAEQFASYGGVVLALDEVHKYPDWARHVKAVYDSCPQLKIIFSGSSLMKLSQQKADISRRAVCYHLPGLSFREFLNFSQDTKFDQTFSLEDITLHHTEIAADISGKIHPLEYFVRYQSEGYYPFFVESRSLYPIRLSEMISHILEVDLPHVHNIRTPSISKIKKLIYMLAVSVPTELNINKLSTMTGAARQMVDDFLSHLQDARLLNIIGSTGSGYRILNKTEKILLENTNIFHALSSEVNPGSLREAFFANQLINSMSMHKGLLDRGLLLSDTGDFVVNKEYIFEVGGKSKSGSQLKGQDRAFIAADGIDCGFANKIPLWLFGFLY